MQDVTSYADKLSHSLNIALRNFAGSECVMVRKLKPNDQKNSNYYHGNCHKNVQKAVEKHGGNMISGWLLYRMPPLIENGMHIWRFHSVWQKPDGKLLDVTEDNNYIGRDKSIFLPDTMRAPDLEKGIAYNNIVVFDSRPFAKHFEKYIQKEIVTNTIYWCDNAAARLLDLNEHSGQYRLLHEEYPENQKMLSEEYGFDVKDGKLVPRPGSMYESARAVPARMLFDYSISG